MVIALGAALGAEAYAQGTSVLQGTVTDASSGAKLADVVVTASSPATQEPQMTVTDSDGFYRLPGLPPGRYTIRIEKEGYRPYSRADLDVSLDRQYRVNIAAQPESMSSEEIVISGLPPIIDIGSVNQGVVLNSQFMDRIPIVSQGPTNFSAMAELAPQARMDLGGVAFSGATSPENSYTVDGVSVRGNSSGNNSGIVPLGFIDQTNIVTGGFQAEVGRTTGGAIRAITRSGSNEFKGELRVNFTPGGLRPMPKAVRSMGDAYAYQISVLSNAFDISASYSGPILKDRLWFFVGLNPARVSNEQILWLESYKINADKSDYLYENDGSIQVTSIDGTRRSRFDETWSIPYIAKLTLLLAPNHTLTLTNNGAYEATNIPYAMFPNGPKEFIAWNGGSMSHLFTNTLLLQYQGSFLNKKLLTQGQVSWFRVSNWSTFSDGSSMHHAPPGSATGTPSMIVRYRNNKGEFMGMNELPWLTSFYDAATRARITAACEPLREGNLKLRRCPLTSIQMGGGGMLLESSSDTVQASFSLTYLMQVLGHHVWKAGLDYEWLRIQTFKGYSGGFVFSDYKLDVTVLRAFGYLTGPDQVQVVKNFTTVASSHQIAWYLQDSWSILDKVTLNAGVRFDNQQIMRTDGSLGITLNNQIAPRVSLIWDPTQQGRSKVYAGYGRYFESVPLSMGDRQLNGEPMFNVAHSPKRLGCDPINNFGSMYTDCPGGSSEKISSTFRNPLLSHKYGFPGTTVSRVDPDLRPQNSDEILAGAEYEIFRDARLAASYTRRWMDYVIEDVSFDESATYLIANPGYGLAKTFPKAVRNYNAVTAEFSKAFSSGWQTQASYTWMTLTGNYEGLINTSNGQVADANVTTAFDLVSLLKNANGRLPGTQTHSIKLHGGKEFEIRKRVTLGIYMSYSGRSGQPINYLGAHLRYGGSSVHVLPMGSGGDAPWVHNLNLMLTAKVLLGKGVNLEVRFDMMNFINLQGVTGVDETFTHAYVLPYYASAGVHPQVAACIAGRLASTCSADTLPVRKSDGTNLERSEINPNFKMPVSFQDPFTARLSVRLTF